MRRMLTRIPGGSEMKKSYINPPRSPVPKSYHHTVASTGYVLSFWNAPLIKKESSDCRLSILLFYECNKMSLLSEIKRAESTPVDYRFIHSVASPICKSMRYVQHEKLPAKPENRLPYDGEDSTNENRHTLLVSPPVVWLFTIMFTYSDISYWCWSV